MDTAEIWTRIEQGERTTAPEAWTLLRDMLHAAQRRGDAPLVAIEAAALTAVSALDRLDQRDTDRETLLGELRSDRKRCRELDAVLVRLLDPDAPDRPTSYAGALAALDEVEPAVRAATSPPASATVDSLPPSDRDAAREARTRGWARRGLVAVLAVPVLLLVVKIASEQRQASAPSADEAIAGATVELLSPAEEQGRLRMEASWARRALACSSYWGRLESIVGWPDLYRDAELDDAEAWSPRNEDDGTEWVEVGWNMDVDTTAVVIVEGANPGAIVAVDELTDLDANTLGAGRRTRLWSGELPPAAEPRFVLVRLPEPRPIRGLRLVLDTARAPGHNSIDAVGLLSE